MGKIKILICEDNNMKFNDIKDSVENLLKDKDIEIVREVYAKGAVIRLKNEKFDYLIQDMQLPINSDGRIDICGGIYVLNQIKYRNIDVKHCICSSDYSSYTRMEENGFKDIFFIDFSSREFYINLKKFLNIL